MYKPFNLRALLVASMLASACAGDVAPTDTDLDNIDPSNEDVLPGESDAGAGTADGGAQHDAATSNEHDSAVGSADKDAGSARDAGRVEDAGRTHDAGADAATNVSCSTLSYETFGKDFMRQYCVSCHGSSAVKGVSLDTLANVQQHAAKVKSEVAGTSMPVPGAAQPSAAERQKLSQWIDCGAH
jgi:hypothetical protein